MKNKNLDKYKKSLKLALKIQKKEDKKRNRKKYNIYGVLLESLIVVLFLSVLIDLVLIVVTFATQSEKMAGITLGSMLSTIIIFGITVSLSDTNN